MDLDQLLEEPIAADQVNIQRQINDLKVRSFKFHSIPFKFHLHETVSIEETKKKVFNSFFVCIMSNVEMNQSMFRPITILKDLL